jgi:hypothetical protein
MRAGDAQTLTATVAPENATNQNVLWYTSNENVATVEDGVVTAVSGGVATITAITAYGEYYAECEVSVIEPKEYTFYIDLGGTVSAYFLGTDADYGGPVTGVVDAYNAREALIAVCDLTYGEGSLVLTETKYGYSIYSINGMPGNGGSMKSEQSDSWDDVYFYPVQYVKEDGVWGQAAVTIPNYEGDATEFAIVFEPITFDDVEHTFADEADAQKYEELKTVYAWPGYGAFGEPFITVLDAYVTGPTELQAGQTEAYVCEIIPDNATNKNVFWYTSDEAIATIDEYGVLTAISAGQVNVIAIPAYTGVEVTYPITVLLTPEPGDEIVVDGLIYKISEDGESVKVVGYEEIPYGILYAPATIEFQGEEYTVSAIAMKAFMDCDDVKSVYSEVDIERHAFYRCKSLENVILADGANNIGASAFAYCDALEGVMMTDVEYLGVNVFYGFSFFDKDGNKLSKTAEDLNGRLFAIVDEPRQFVEIDGSDARTVRTDLAVGDFVEETISVGDEVQTARATIVAIDGDELQVMTGDETDTASKADFLATIIPSPADLVAQGFVESGTKYIATPWGVVECVVYEANQSGLTAHAYLGSDDGVLYKTEIAGMMTTALVDTSLFE